MVASCLRPKYYAPVHKIIVVLGIQKTYISPDGQYKVLA